MENLLFETIRVLQKHNKTAEDVLFVTDGERWCSVEQFADQADFEYDEGYGGHEINGDLKIVGEDWWLERHEYDGAEWWEYKELPVKPESEGETQILRNPF
jgi:hypothetical protein